jgi:hypothetical protein
MFDSTSRPHALRPTLHWAAVAVSVFFAALAGASPEETAQGGCRSAFVTSLSKDGAVAADFRISFLTEAYVATEAQYAAGEYSYDLLARSVRTGLPVATVTCVVDDAGSVVAILTQKTSQGPALAAR